MSTVDFLARLSQMDVRVSLDGEKLRLSAPPGVMTDELKEEFARHKPYLIELLQSGGGDDAPALVPGGARKGPQPLSSAQERMWVLHQLEPDSPAYNIVEAERVRGVLDTNLLKSAWSAVLDRHEVLRARFPDMDGVPFMEIADEQDGTYRSEDLSNRSDEGPTEADLQSFLHAETRRRFDLVHGPLAILIAVRLGPREHVLVLRMHHIVADQWSLWLIHRDLTAMYALLAAGQSLPPASDIRYIDYTDWQRRLLQGPSAERSLRFWRGRLAGIEPLELSAAKRRTAAGADEGGQVVLPIRDDLLDRVAAMAGASGSTLFMAMLAAFSALLYRCTHRADLPIGVPIAGRGRRELEDIVGLFVNTLVVRVEVKADDLFSTLLTRVRDATLDAYAHQDIPFERLVQDMSPARGDGAAAPLVQVMFNLLNTPSQTLAFPGVTSDAVALPRRASALDLTLIVDLPGRCVVAEFRRDLLPADGVERLLRQFIRVLEAVAVDATVPVGQLPILEPAEDALLHEWNRTGRAYDLNESVEAMVATQVARTPQRIAVRGHDGTLTYGALDAQATALADELRSRGVGPDSVVGVCLERSTRMVVALLAILKAGGAYLPLDPAFPSRRLAWIIEDSGVGLILVDRASLTALPAAATSAVLDLDGPWPACSPADRAGRLHPVMAEHLAYVLYTSGSTGEPKGVEVPRRALANFINAFRERPGFSADDVLVAVTTLSFDIAALELFLPLVCGATLVVASRDEAMDGRRLAALLEASGATVMQATPATWRMLIDAEWRGSADFRVLCGGEAMPVGMAIELQQRAAAVWNLYGPTETTIWSTVEPIDVSEANVSIGRPIANTEAYVLDPTLQPTPIGVAGELCIGGYGVARGYRGRADLTAARFIPDAFSGRPGARLYRTGDRARFRFDGRLEYLGRFDHQVKVRGFRIELGEVESVLAEHPAVGEAAACVRTGASGPVLVAYVTPATGSIDAQALRSHVRDRLPAYMVPSIIAVLDALPLTPNGKVDRRALAERDMDGTAADPSVASLDDTERAILAVWTALLGRPTGLDDDFFAVGGHSLMAARVTAAIERDLGVHIPLSTFFDITTIRQLAAFVRRCGAAPDLVGAPTEAFRSLVPIRRGGSQIPIVAIHAGAGQVLFYRHLVECLGSDQPFYGMQAPAGLDGLVPPYGGTTSVEALAEQYLAELLRVRPRGPYVLLGACTGGHIALEMAQRLRQGGESVGPLIIIDSWLSNTGDVLQARAARHRAALEGLSLPERLAYIARKVQSTAVFEGRQLMQRLRGIPRARRLKRAYREMVRDRVPLPADIRDALFTHASVTLGAQYRPRPYDGPVVLVRSATYAESPWMPTEQVEHMGWRGIAVGPFDIVDLPGTHLDMCAPPIVTRLADVVRGRLARQDARFLATPPLSGRKVG